MRRVRNVETGAWRKTIADVEGELAAVAEDADGDGTVSTAEQDDADGYLYTADGERILRTQGGATTLYLGHQELTLDHSTGAVSGQRYYTFGGMTIATRTGYNFGDVDTIISDQQGTGTVQIPNVDGPGQRTHRYTDPYGKPRGPQAGTPGAGGGADGDWTGEHGFLDKPVDATGLTAIGARMYDPLLGKFISVDPIMDLTDPQQWNGYAYSHNNPTTFTDPTGMRELCETGYSCNYGKGGSITKAKKKPKRKPTINDIRARAAARERSTVRYQTPRPNQTTPWGLGVQWLSGNGPRQQTFRSDDDLTKLYRKHEHVADVTNYFDTRTRNGDYRLGHSYKYDYALGGTDGVGRYIKDYSTLATFGTTGNLAFTFVGSHRVRMTPISENPDGTVVWEYVATNESDIESATHPPVIGYTQWWSDNVGSPITNAVGDSGPMSPTYQTITFDMVLGRLENG